MLRFAFAMMGLGAALALGGAESADAQSFVGDCPPGTIAPPSGAPGCAPDLSGPVSPQARALGLLGRAHAYVAAANYDRALADLNDALKLDPTLVDALIGRGFLLHQRGDDANALIDLREAVRLAPDNASAHDNLGDVLQAQRNSDAALAEYNTAIGLDPRDASAYAGRGVSYASKADTVRAIADYTQAIALAAPAEKAAPLRNRGVAYSATGELDKAIADFTASIAIAPVFPRAYVNRGVIYARRGDLQLAIADFSSALLFDSKAADAYLLRGIAGQLTGADRQALLDVNQAVSLTPNQALTFLWQEIISGRKTELAAYAARADTSVWPGPVVRMYLGQTTLDALIASTEALPPATRIFRTCQADFYAAELKRLEDVSAAAEAARLFQDAIDVCPPTMLEWFAAKAELAAMKPAAGTSAPAAPAPAADTKP